MSQIYETDRIVAEYLLFHYGSEQEILPWSSGPREALDFPVRTVSHFTEQHVERALDVGCAVGRSSFELSRAAQEVVGIDYSKAFIDAAKDVQGLGQLSYSCLQEGHVSTQLMARRPAEAVPDRVKFEVGDAMNLPESLGTFDQVHAANLVCRLPEPRSFLHRLASLVKSGGEVVLATPCTWLEEFTTKEHWPKGQTLEWLKEELSSDFELKRTADEPFLIRETARKFQWTVSMITVWKKR